MAPVPTSPPVAPVTIPAGKAAQLPFHPLDPPTAQEISLAATTVKQHLIESLSVKAFKILTIFLKEPAKAAVIEAIKFPGGAATQSNGEPIKRQVEAHVIDQVTGAVYEFIVTLPPSARKAEIAQATKLPEGTQPGITPEELCLAEEKIRECPQVIEAAAKIGVKPDELYCDGWSIGWDERFPGRRLQQAILYARFDGPHENLYSHPLDFYPVLDTNTGEVLAIDYPAYRTGKDGASTSATTAPPEKGSFDEPTTRPRIKPPMERHEYLPETVTDSKGAPLKMRPDLKPLHVIQPDGVSFKRTGNVIEWQKWKFHVGFHPREGMVLSAISYKDTETDGATPDSPVERSLFYRISFSEMVVPYGSPDYPHYKKFAFDVGEYGLGYLANELDLGCDCLGTIDYLDGHIVTHSGEPKTIKNAICIHEEDAGTGWKHTDYRVGGKTSVVRNRKLVVSSVYTVSNYEYRVAYEFGLDGTLGCEIGLTGILNLSLLAPGEKATYGTEVAPQITAHIHQHLFSVRIDPHIDGPLNSIVEQHIEVSPHKTGSAENWAGNAFDSKTRVLATSGEAVRDTDADSERTWVFVNENKKHYASGKPVGYKLMLPNQPKLHSQPDSICSIRAPFARHAIWTVPYEEGRLYPAGKYCVQTTKTPEDSLPGWVGDGKDEIVNKDIVSFVTVGVTHVVRPEVMPTEHAKFLIKPTSFFRRNPMLDVAQDKDGKSVLAATNGSSCCA